MIQLLLTLLGLLLPANNINTSNLSHDSPVIQNTNIGEELDTGGDTIPFPPKK